MDDSPTEENDARDRRPLGIKPFFEKFFFGSERLSQDRTHLFARHPLSDIGPTQVRLLRILCVIWLRFLLVHETFLVHI